MTPRLPAEGSVQRTYDAFASTYDDFNHDYMYERWTRRLLEKAEEAGLQGDRLLDVGCGTGLSFISMLARGWRVTACDISPGMLEMARQKVGDAATLLTADMRDLPALGQFDLIWAVNDPLNYLLTVEELEATLTGMRRNLAPGGILLFDVNTSTTYRKFFSSEYVTERNGRRLEWKGRTPAAEVSPGSIHEADFTGEGRGVEAHVHRQRHFVEEEVLAAIDAAGLRCLAVLGELNGALEHGLTDEVHTKAVYICS